jgi:tRNA-Thr(GGU) m(6)t(6)A37 methyltransferase TsaA
MAARASFPRLFDNFELSSKYLEGFAMQRADGTEDSERRAIALQPIGIIRSSHAQPAGTPIQPTYAQQAPGEVIVHPRFVDALTDIEGFERIWLLYHFHRAGPFRLRVVPYRDTQERGTFATRAPTRPNGIGMSVVELLGRAGNVLRVGGLDILDGTPLLDIKPYVPQFDAFPDARAGWLDQGAGDRTTADNRFHPVEEEE